MGATPDGVRDESPAGLCWFVVSTKRFGLRSACTQLGHRGVGTYLPMIVEWPRPAVGGAVHPMFPGYLFVHATLPRDFWAVAWAPGVKGFVSFGGEPSQVDDSIVGSLRHAEGVDGLIHWGCPRENRGVRITDGPFRDLAAVLERRLPARERVVVLLEILHRTTRVELPEKFIAQA